MKSNKGRYVRTLFFCEDDFSTRTSFYSSLSLSKKRKEEENSPLACPRVFKKKQTWSQVEKLSSSLQHQQKFFIRYTHLHTHTKYGDQRQRKVSEARAFGGIFGRRRHGGWLLSRVFIHASESARWRRDFSS